MAIVRENIPQASGKSSLAQMLAQRAQPPAMAAAPPPALNGVRGMPPTPLMRPPLPPVAAAPPGVPAVSGGMGQATVPASVKAAMLMRLLGGAGGAGGPGGPGGAPPIGRA